MTTLKTVLIILLVGLLSIVVLLVVIGLFLPSTAHV